MKHKLLVALLLLIAFYAGKRFSDFEHRPIVIEIHQSHAVRGLQQADHQQAITLLPLESKYPEYSTSSEAAFEALKAIAAHPSSVRYEWGGALIVMADGKYSFTEPDTDYMGDAVRIQYTTPKGATLIGGYHSHPCLVDHDTEYFSPEDLVAPIFLHRIAVMGDFCTGNAHAFLPGDKPDVEHPPGDSDNIWLTKGRIFGQFTTNIGLQPL